MVDRTQVAIIGAGPAGLVLGRLLELAGIEATILELRDRTHVEQRVRAGMLEHGTVELLGELGVGERARREGFRHHSFEVRFRGQRHEIPMTELTGRTAWIYGQQEVVKDLIAARVATAAPLRFEVSDIRLEGWTAPHRRCTTGTTAPSARCAATRSPGATGFTGSAGRRSPTAC